jgi:hypothetical protein
MINKDFIVKWEAGKNLSNENKADVVYRDPYSDWGETIKKILEDSMGLRCITTKSILSAFLRVLTSSPKILITDLYVHPSDYPEIGPDWQWDGVSLTRTIRRLGLHIGIVWFTAFGTVDKIREGFKELHITDFLDKSDSDLVSNLHRVIDSELKR